MWRGCGRYIIGASPVEKALLYLKQSAAWPKVWFDGVFVRTVWRLEADWRIGARAACTSGCTVRPNQGSHSTCHTTRTGSKYLHTSIHACKPTQTLRYAKIRRHAQLIHVHLHISTHAHMCTHKCAHAMYVPTILYRSGVSASFLFPALLRLPTLWLPSWASYP